MLYIVCIYIYIYCIIVYIYIYIYIFHEITHVEGTESFPSRMLFIGFLKLQNNHVDSCSIIHRPDPESTGRCLEIQSDTRSQQDSCRHSPVEQDMRS